MVQLTVRLTAASGRAHELIEALHALMRHSRRLRGCTDAHIAADVDEANSFWYSEDWQDEPSLAEELRTDRFSQLLSLMETSATAARPGVPGDCRDAWARVREGRPRGWWRRAAGAWLTQTDNAPILR